jgi:hypothetical protein
MDQGDRGAYCCAVLTLFKPWRTGHELKSDAESWHEAFGRYNFRTKALTLMKNFNVRYECNDARDDFASQDRAHRRALPTFQSNGDADEDLFVFEGEPGETDYSQMGAEGLNPVLGPKHLSKQSVMLEAASVMRSSGWALSFPESIRKNGRLIPTEELSGSQWKARIALLRDAVFSKKFSNAPTTMNMKTRPREHDIGFNVSLLDSYFFTKYFKAKSANAQKTTESISTKFRLNKEQDRAFRLVANHAVDDTAPPLRMYLGGVGGTGKSQVIKALMEFFDDRNEAHRLLVLGPTGTSAALLQHFAEHRARTFFFCFATFCSGQLSWVQFWPDWLGSRCVVIALKIRSQPNTGIFDAISAEKSRLSASHL